MRCRDAAGGAYVFAGCELCGARGGHMREKGAGRSDDYRMWALAAPMARHVARVALDA